MTPPRRCLGARFTRCRQSPNGADTVQPASRLRHGFHRVCTVLHFNGQV